MQKHNNQKKNNNNIVSFSKKLKKFFAVSEKPKKEKQKRPKTYAFRKLGASVFWLLFIFMLIVVVVSISSDSSPTDANTSEVKVVSNPSAKPEAVQFAHDFISNYYTWVNNNEGWEDRANRLSYFIADGLDEHAGLVKESVVWDSNYQKSVIKKIDEVDSNSVYITLKVWAEMSREVEKEVMVKEKNGSKKTKEKETEIEVETETKPIVKYIVVPLTFNGSSYGVYELPYVTYLDESTNVEKQTNTKNTAEKDGNKVVNIKKFLDTFFSSYAEDDRDRLGYILNDKNYSQGMNGTMNFVEVKESSVYEGESEGENLVIAKVTFEDPELNTQINSIYHLIVTKEKERYIVTSINAGKNK